MDEEHRTGLAKTSGSSCDLMLRLYLLINAQPDIVNQKFTLFDGSERSFADLMTDDGQQYKAKHRDAVRHVITVMPLLFDALFDGEADVRLME